MENRRIFGLFGQLLKPVLTTALVLCCACINIAGAGGFTSGINPGLNITTPSVPAQLTCSNSVCVDYNLGNNGTWPSNATVQTMYIPNTQNPLVPPTPIRPGYTFDEWYWYSQSSFACKYSKSFNGKLGAFELSNTASLLGTCATNAIKTIKTGVVSATALWTPTVYHITYILNGGTCSNACDDLSSYTIESATFNLPAYYPPSFTTWPDIYHDAGYKFGGWYADSNFGGSAVTKINKGTYGNKTFYAKWTYSITYIPNGSNGAGKTVDGLVKGKSVTTLNASEANIGSKDGYHFNYWCVSDPYCLNTNRYTNAGSQFTDTGMGVLTNGNINFYARWEPNTYKIKFNKNDTAANGSMSDQNMTYDVSANLTPNAFTKTGYVFDGWCTESGSNCTVVYTDGQSVKNLTTTNNGTKTLYAKWKLAVYEFNLNVNTTDTLSTTPTSKIYEKYNTGWYKNEDETGEITSESGIIVPKIQRPRIAYFDGYYVCQNATGESNCKQIIDKNGFLSQNHVKNLSSGGDLYAKWISQPGMFITANARGATDCWENVWCPGGDNLNISVPYDRGIYSCAETTGNSFMYSTISSPSITWCYAKVTLDGNGGVTTDDSSSIEVLAMYGREYCLYNGVKLCTSPLSTDYTYSLTANATEKTIFTNGDKVLAGWYTAPEGGTKVTQATQLSGDTTLYAHWEEIGVIYEFMDGTGRTDPYTAQDVGTHVPNPTRENYIFAGWCLADDYHVEHHDDGDIITCDNVYTSVEDGIARRTFNMDVPNVSRRTVYKALWEPDKFQMDIIDIDSDEYFAFKLSAQGEFFIDWGDGIVEYIDKDNTNEVVYSHTYTSDKADNADDGKYTIHFGSKTGITRPSGVSLVSFGVESESVSVNENIIIGSSSDDSIKAVYGSLGELFGFDSGSNENKTAEDSAFRYTFYSCSRLTEVSSELFSGIKIAGNKAFSNTFNGCSELKGVPAGLFGEVTSAGDSAFHSTFFMSGLTTIPAGLFGKLTSVGNNTFNSTFAFVAGVTEVPSGLFSKITSVGDTAFESTFHGCHNLQTIQDGLFSGAITTVGDEVFEGTFYNCNKLKQLPNALFTPSTTKVSPTIEMFFAMFRDCTELTGYVPTALFEPYDDADYAAGPMINIFDGTALNTSCEAGWTEIPTEFRRDWRISNTIPDNSEACPDYPEDYSTATPELKAKINKCYAISCKPGVWNITLDNNGGTGDITNIYEKYGVGFYSTESGAEDEDESEIITGITPPTRDNYVFKGYYNGTKQIFTSEGAFAITEPAKEFTDAATLTAKWEYGCPYGQKPNADNNGCVCDGDVGYISDGSVCVCDNVNGYGMDSGTGKCVKYCSGDHPSYDAENDTCYKEDETTILPCSCGEGVDTCTFAGGADTTSCRIYVGSDECVDYAGNCEVNSVVCDTGYNVTSGNKCEKCSTGLYCPGNSQDPQSCPSGMTSPAGSQSEYDCGKVFHIGDKIMYLHRYEGKPANKAVLVIESNDEKYYANLTDETGGKVMTNGSNAKLHITVGSKDYTAYDNSVSYYGE